jgi:hypothetical protein
MSGSPRIIRRGSALSAEEADPGESAPSEEDRLSGERISGCGSSDKKKMLVSSSLQPLGAARGILRCLKVCRVCHVKEWTRGTLSGALIANLAIAHEQLARPSCPEQRKEREKGLRAGSRRSIKSGRMYAASTLGNIIHRHEVRVFVGWRQIGERKRVIEGHDRKTSLEVKKQN